MTNIIERFESKIFYSPCGCWYWLSFIDSCGRARINYKGKNVPAARISHEIFKGTVGDKHVLHYCDNPACVNPNHLFLGTHQDNMEDMRKKGRASRLLGSKNPASILTENDVLKIKSMKGISVSIIAKEFGVAEITIYKILQNKIWSYL